MKNFIFIVLLLLASCANKEIIRRKTPETTSTIIDIENSDNNDLLSPEEKRREAVLEYYRKLREEDNKSGRARNIPRYSRPKPPPVKKQRTFRPVNEKDQFVEIEQQTIFFCMDKRTSTKFRSTDDCKSFTENLITKCQNDYEQGDPRLTTCVKSGLR